VKALDLVLLFVSKPRLLGGQVGEQGVDKNGGSGTRVRETEVPGGVFMAALAYSGASMY